MINRQNLLNDLQDLLKGLEADLLDRSDSTEVPEVGKSLRGEYEKAKQAERTAQNYEDWRSDHITQVAAAWVLSCVFVRFLEDNRLIDPPKIAGPGERLQRARDEHEIYFRMAPTETDREYLLTVFDELAKLPGTRDVFGEHNPIHELPRWLSGDAAGELLRFFRKIDANSGELIHDFTDPEWDTRFLGDLYQDLSEAARKKYALLQTPEFVEEFILDRTLDPAVDEFGLDAPAVTDREGKPVTEAGFRMIDPACGSGHFLLGAFPRILDRWQKLEPETNVRELVQRALDSIHGVDVNPYAIAIARFRLLLAAIQACGITRLADSPAFQINLACGDSLIHGSGKAVQQYLGDWNPIEHVYQAEDLPELSRILKLQGFHAVVANPPYIAPKDPALNRAYRERYTACHGKYSLSAPFAQRIFALAKESGFTGQITSNAFMKREFGKKLVEDFFPQVELTHVIDTAGAYIPGHGTPTVILLGRHRRPESSTVRAVMGIQGEPGTPPNPAHGQVWSAIVSQVDRPGSESAFVSVNDTNRQRFSGHPWSIGGGGAAELKERLDGACGTTLESHVESIGITSVTGEDEFYILPDEQTPRRLKVEFFQPFLVGDEIRDYALQSQQTALWVYDDKFNVCDLSDMPRFAQLAWPCKSAISRRRRFGTPMLDLGLSWYQWQELYSNKFKTDVSIPFVEFATHNHFVLDKGQRIYNRSAPIIKLPAGSVEDVHLQLVGVLNTSTACFWLKQVCHNKGSTVDQHGARQRTRPFEDFFVFNSTKLKKFPVPAQLPLDVITRIRSLADSFKAQSPSAVVHSGIPTPELIARQHERWSSTLRGMISAQEELDWQFYRLYGLIDDDLKYDQEPPPIQLGQRAFEIVMARQMAAGELETMWFERHGSTPITELPDDWPDDFKRLVERRIEVIETNPQIGLIEQPEYKRRWNTEPWESQVEKALKSWLLDRLEGYFDFDGRMSEGLTQRREGAKEEDQREKLSAFAPLREISLYSIARLADEASRDEQFMEVGEVYRDDAAFDVHRLVEELVGAEHVPLLPILRYKPAGLRKRVEWEKTWELQREDDRLTQRREDAKKRDEENLSDFAPLREIPVPPKYKSSDFISTGGARYWHLRGKLDVPKERWVSFPHCEGPDGTLMIAWAGYDHLQLARAISAHYVDVQERLGGRDDPRLEPLLSGLIELLPWLKQWHNDVDPEFNVPMGDYFEGFLQDEARQMDKTVDEIKNWQPPQRTTRRRKRAST